MSDKAASSVKRSLEFTYESARPGMNPARHPMHRILAIDDDPMMRKLILEMLGSRYEVFTSSHGLEIPRLMTEFSPDLVIMDVMMPWIDGLQLCRSLKSNPAWKRVPIIFVTGRKKPADVELGLHQGADAYLTKPFSMVDLIQNIRILLREPVDELF